MNQGRIWCVVYPTIGLPLLIGSVAVTSLIVHASVMSHTTWMSTYWQGSRARAAANDTAAPATLAAAPQPGFVISVAPAAGPGAGQTSFVVTVSPTAATAAADAPSRPSDTLALADQALK